MTRGALIEEVWQGYPGAALRFENAFFADEAMEAPPPLIIWFQWSGAGSRFAGIRFGRSNSTAPLPAVGSAGATTSNRTQKLASNDVIAWMLYHSPFISALRSS